MLCAAKLHKCDVAYTGAPVTVSVGVGHRDGDECKWKEKMKLNKANREAKKET